MSTMPNDRKLFQFTLCALILVLCYLSVFHGSCLPTTASTFCGTFAGETPSFELAKKESFGFFDDIDDVTWRRHQQRARTESLYSDPNNPNINSSDVARWLLFNVDPIFTCPNLRRVGGRGDGPKWVCDPHRLAQQPDCLIYSIGSAGIYLFEDGMVDMLKANDPTSSKSSTWLPNCEIHVFDPNPIYERDKDAERSNIHYHAIALKSSRLPDRQQSWTKKEYLSLKGIQQRLGHENRRIDIFKIDCEGCEWVTYTDFLNPEFDIRQILIETHILPAEPNVFFDRFLEMGFVLFSKEANTHPGTVPKGGYFEWGFVKLHPEFSRPSMN